MDHLKPCPEVVSGLIWDPLNSGFKSNNMNQYFVYILTNKLNKVLSIGVTDNLERRMYEHKIKMINGFTKKYNLTKLIYFEETADVESAIEREKQLKNWYRDWKIKLINEFNPDWKDLSTWDEERDAETSSDIKGDPRVCHPELNSGSKNLRFVLNLEVK
jgi:putative endonuclease